MIKEICVKIYLNSTKTLRKIIGHYQENSCNEYANVWSNSLRISVSETCDHQIMPKSSLLNLEKTLMWENTSCSLQTYFFFNYISVRELKKMVNKLMITIFYILKEIWFKQLYALGRTHCFTSLCSLQDPDTSCEIPGWMKHKLQSRLWGEISITSNTQTTPPLSQKEKKN